MIFIYFIKEIWFGYNNQKIVFLTLVVKFFKSIKSLIYFYSNLMTHLLALFSWKRKCWFLVFGKIALLNYFLNCSTFNKWHLNRAQVHLLLIQFFMESIFQGKGCKILIWCIVAFCKEYVNFGTNLFWAKYYSTHLWFLHDDNNLHPVLK